MYTRKIKEQVHRKEVSAVYCLVPGREYSVGREGCVRVTRVSIRDIRELAAAPKLRNRDFQRRWGCFQEVEQFLFQVYLPPQMGAQTSACFCPATSSLWAVHVRSQSRSIIIIIIISTGAGTLSSSSGLYLKYSGVSWILIILKIYIPFQVLV